VTLRFDIADQPPPGLHGPPRSLRIFSAAAIALILASVLTTSPEPGLTGKGLDVSLSVVAFVAGLALCARRRELAPGDRLLGLALLGAASSVLTWVQPDSAGYAGVYVVVVIAGMRVAALPALVVAGGTVAAQLTIIATGADHPGMSAAGLLFSVVPWFMITRLIRQLADRTNRAETLVEELRESREANARAAALNERGRVARELHDVLAHSLSALALQLEGTRLLARSHGADAEVVAGLERAHKLAAGGLAEARQAIAALRGEALPGPERLQDLADAFAEQSPASCELRVLGAPRQLSSEASLALYRTAQEALTNIRRHSAATHVDITLAYDRAGTTLTVADHGPGAPVAAAFGGVAGSGGGYGLTGMRERAELVGGRLCAEPTADGFVVRLWLPAEPQAQPAPSEQGAPA